HGPHNGAWARGGGRSARAVVGAVRGPVARPGSGAVAAVRVGAVATRTVGPARRAGVGVGRGRTAGGLSRRGPGRSGGRGRRRSLAVPLLAVPLPPGGVLGLAVGRAVPVVAVPVASVTAGADRLLERAAVLAPADEPQDEADEGE